MKTLTNKKTVSLVLLAGLVCSSLSFDFFPGASAANPSTVNVSANVQSMVLAYASQIKLINAKVGPQALITGRLLFKTADCGLSPAPATGLVQTTAGIDLFTKPAGCFSISSAETPASQNRPLTVQSRPQTLPRVVVYHFRDTVTNQLHRPGLPQSQPLAALPREAYLVLLSFAVFIQSAAGSGRKPVKRDGMVEISLPRLMVLRC